MNFRQLDFISLFKWLPTAPPPQPRQPPPKKQPPKEQPVASEPATRIPLPDLEETARELLRGIGCAKLAAEVKVRWHSRLRTTAGQAYYTHCLVRLNPRLIQFGMEEVDKTLRHELAHLVARFRAGRRRIEPHGPEWQQACRELGIADEQRCHNLPLPRSQQRRQHRYRCPSCRREYDRVRPFRRAVACLDCCRKHARGCYDDRFKLEKIPCK